MTNRALESKDPKPVQLALDLFASGKIEKPNLIEHSRSEERQELKLVDVQAKHVQEQIKVRYSQRAKRMSISVSHNGEVELIAPGRKYRKPSLKRIRDYASANKEWIEKTTKKFQNKLDSFADHDRPNELDLKYIKQVVRIHYTESLNEKKRNLLERDGQLYIAAQLTNEEVAKKLGAWLAKKAKQIILPELARFSEITNLNYQKASIRGQKSRWGSCSSKGNISLNYCILLLPKAHGDYVLIHELCHLEHFDHSRRFWNLVRRYEPDYRKLDKGINDLWLNLPSWLDLRHKKASTEEIIYIRL